MLTCQVEMLGRFFKFGGNLIHSSRSIRLPSYDYTSSGAYFITLCTQNREQSLGEIINHEMKFSRIGEIVSEKWFDIPNHHNVKLGEFVVMPNHIHGIIWIVSQTVGASPGMTNEKFLGVTDERERVCQGKPRREFRREEDQIDQQRERICRGNPRPRREEDQIDQQKDRVCRGKPRQKEIYSRKFGEHQSGSLSMIINQFKGSVKRCCNKNDHKWFGWQRNYYEHIIRNNKDLFNTTEYIKKNPINWSNDEYKA